MASVTCDVRAHAASCVCVMSKFVRCKACTQSAGMQTIVDWLIWHKSPAANQSSGMRKVKAIGQKIDPIDHFCSICLQPDFFFFASFLLDQPEQFAVAAATAINFSLIRLYGAWFTHATHTHTDKSGTQHCTRMRTRRQAKQISSHNILHNDGVWGHTAYSEHTVRSQ